MIFLPGFLVKSRQSLVSSPGQNLESNPFTASKSVFLTIKFIEGKSETSFFGIGKNLKQTGPPPKQEAETQPPAFCIKESSLGVMPGPQTAAIFGFSK